MGLEEVRNEIKEKAAREKDKIISEARKEAQSILAKTIEKAKNAQVHELESAKRIVESIERKEITTTELDIKKKMLNIKKESITEVFDEALKTLGKDKKQSKYLEALLKKAKKSMDVAKIRANAKDKSEFKDYTFEKDDISGGFIAENKDGTIRMNYSYDTLMEDLKGETVTDVAKILFENASK